MLVIPNSIAPQRTAFNTSNANTSVVTVNANSKQQWQLEQVIVSVDRTINTAENNLHLIINTDYGNVGTFNTEILHIGLGSNTLPINFPPLEFPKGAGFQVKLVDGGTVIENHVNIIYR